MPLELQYRDQSAVPVEIEGLTPDWTRDKSIDEIERFEAFRGNQKLPLAELFKISGDAADGRIDFVGDLAGVHWIGAKMTGGEIHVHGNAGRHLGSGMRGGSITVDGSAGDFAGCEMHHGEIRIRGDAGHAVGGAYPGSRRGMTGGSILVDGAAGDNIGQAMRRGLIAIGGAAGDLAGFNMLAGSIFLFGPSGIRHGAGMKRGTIGLFGDPKPTLLPTFRRACQFEPVMLRMVFASLTRRGFAVPQRLFGASFNLFHGDLLEGGRGEVMTVDFPLPGR
jgi:formylmethanofuran dehydrogenase subunit C